MVMNALNTAVTALGRSSPQSAIVNADAAGSHWCHDCKERVSLTEEFQCSRCSGFFVEEHSQDSPSFVIPQLNEDGEPITDEQAQAQRTESHRQQNRRLLRNMLDMTLTRIRQSNPEFREAELVGA